MILTFGIVYVLLSTLAIVARQAGWKIAPLCKGIPVASLVLFLIANIFISQIKVDTAFILFILGLAFGLAGDIFFLDKSRFFKIGIVSFFIGHLIYIVAFICCGMKFRLIPLFPAYFYFASYSLVLFGVLLKKHKKYLGIGIMYLISLLIMVTCSEFVDFNFAQQGLYTFFYVGAFLFSMSDGVLTYRIFGQHFKYSDIIVLSSYYLAQGIITLNALIVAGLTVFQG